MAFSLDTFATVRRLSVDLCGPLSPEDAVLQSMPDVSPPKWHLAHTTWFFETMVLARFAANFKPFHPKFSYLFNSYYEALGPRQPRPERGLLSRPSLAEVIAYRASIDEQMHRLFSASQGPEIQPAQGIAELGLHHEQQHQELLLMDIKHNFFRSPLRPAYRAKITSAKRLEAPPLQWVEFSEGLASIGHSGTSFSYDNERPAHAEFVPACRLASRLTTNAEYLEFIRDHGYERPELWLADGWTKVQQEGWRHPLYWTPTDENWEEFTLNGMRPIDPHRPVCHVSYFEAEAFARWAKKRLPSEAQWERAARSQARSGGFLEESVLTGDFEPRVAEARPKAKIDAKTETKNHQPLLQMLGDAWEWTQSAYLPYPGFQPENGALGEYNGKFMNGQMVLRGGASVTPKSHVRSSYRNFFYPQMRWQFSGIRLMEEA